METIVMLIVWLLVLGLIYYCLSLLPLPAPFGVILQVLFVILALFVILSAFGIVGSGPIHLGRAHW